MKLILLLPLVAYLCLMLVNMNLMQDFQSVNLFWFMTLQGPIILLSSVFFVVYGVLIYITYSGINSLQAHKIKKLDQEITRLKSELYTGQKDLINSIQWDYKKQFEEFKKDNDAKLETMIRFNQYTLEKVIEETYGSFTQYRKETQKLLKNAQWVDTSILDRMKFWEK